MDRGPLIADTDALIDYVEAQGCHLKMRALLRAGRLATTAVSVFEIWRGCRTDTERAEARRMCVVFGCTPSPTPLHDGRERWICS